MPIVVEEVTASNIKTISKKNTCTTNKSELQDLDEETMIMMMIDDDGDKMSLDFVWSQDERAFEENEEEIMDMMMCGNRKLQLPPNISMEGLPPIVDLSLPSPELQRQLSLACQHWGVFYLANHGISHELLNHVHNLAHALFSLPFATKLNARRSSTSFDGFGQPLISKFFKSHSWTQGFTMMGSSIAQTTAKLLPSPHHPNPFRGPFEEYEKTTRKLVGKLMILILQGLGVDVENFKHTHFNPNVDCHGALQLNYYPKCPQPELTIGIPPHTDSTCLTILYQGDVPGLEIYKDGHWMLIPPFPNMLVVHVGDMLQVLSNDKFKSAIHRAIPNKRRARLSMAYLCGPPLHTIITPPLEVVNCSQTKRALYKPLTWMEYLHTKTKHFMSSLDYFKV